MKSVGSTRDLEDDDFIRNLGFQANWKDDVRKAHKSELGKVSWHGE